VRFWLLVLVLILIFLVFGGYGFVARGLFESAIVLVFGWMQFLQRTIPAIAWNWSLVGMSGLTAVGILLLTHQLMGGVFNQVAAARNLTWRWSWRWTWSGFVGLLLLFFIGMSVVGMVHQVGWLLSAREPMMEAKDGRWRDYGNMMQLDSAVRVALEDQGGDIAKARAALRSNPSGFLNRPPRAQAYHVLLVTDREQHVIGRLILPYDGQRRDKFGGYYSFDAGRSDMCPWPKMQNIIRTNLANLIAL